MTDTHKQPTPQVEHPKDCCAQCAKNNIALGQLICWLAGNAIGVLSLDEARELLNIIDN